MTLNHILLVALVVLVVLIILLIVCGYYFYNKDVFEYSSIDEPYIEPIIYDNFITQNDAEYIIKQSENSFRDSEIVGDKINTNIRKSQTHWINKNTDPIAKKIIEKVCEITKMPFENAEDLQVVKYKPNGFYNQHHDACCDNVKECHEFVKRGGQRIVTMVIYLNDGFEGGSTKFPTLGKEYKPSKTGGILFFPTEKNGKKCHPKSLHAGTPVIKGEKYIANVWIRERKFV